MKNLIRQSATNLTVTAPYQLASGEPFALGALFMVASTAAASGEQVAGVRRGEYSLPKATGESWAVGDKLYWDAANKRLTKAAGSLAHVAIASGGAGSSATTGPAVLATAP